MQEKKHLRVQKTEKKLDCSCANKEWKISFSSSVRICSFEEKV